MPDKLYKMIKKVFFRQSEIKDDFDLKINMNRDWKIVCGCLLLFFVLIFSFDYYLLTRIDIFGVGKGHTQVTSVSDLDFKKLENVMKSWEERVKEFNIYSSVAPKVVDPSL